MSLTTFGWTPRANRIDATKCRRSWSRIGGSPARLRENVFWADDDPVQRVTTYAPWELAEGTGLLAEEVGHPYGIHGIFEDQGHVMTRIREEVSARMPRPEERRDLRLPPGVPVLDVLHTSLDQQGQPYELTRFVMRADLTGLLYDVPVE
jgi:GntR family transcriptional regulator